jgi:hypothetical protein
MRAQAVVCVLLVLSWSAGCAEPGIAPLPENNGPDNSCDDACSVGRFICVGNDEVWSCVQGEDSCTGYVLTETCSDNELCVENLCVQRGACVDADRDGHGQGCVEGDDCDDSSPDRYFGAREICDGIDNDCNGAPDDGDACNAECDEACTVGGRQCTGDGRARECRRDDVGCGVWSNPVDCGEAGCSEGFCQDERCEDADGDGRGVNCAFGPDCDDRNDAVYQGAEELCDGLDNDCDNVPDNGFEQLGDDCETGQGECAVVGQYGCSPDGLRLDCNAGNGAQPTDEICGDGRDNDCDGSTDEGFDQVGQACSDGQNECRAEGQIVCDGAGTRCNAQARDGSPEVCDMADNDCDGDIDEGGVCTRCVEDQYEENDSSAAGAPLPKGQSLTATACGSINGNNDDRDWFALGRYTAGQTIRVDLTVNNNGGEMHLEIYGPNFVAASAITESTATVTATAPSTRNYFLWAAANTNVRTGTSYTLRHR